MSISRIVQTMQSYATGSLAIAPTLGTVGLNQPLESLRHNNPVQRFVFQMAMPSERLFHGELRSSLVDTEGEPNRREDAEGDSSSSYRGRDGFDVEGNIQIGPRSVLILSQDAA